jgi:hypothetical protein
VEVGGIKLRDDVFGAMAGDSDCSPSSSYVPALSSSTIKLQTMFARQVLRPAKTLNQVRMRKW